METKIFHYRTPLAQQTIACAIENNKVFKFAIAACHPKDQFCKHTGRVKALGRLKSDQCSSYLDEEISFEDFRKEYFDYGPIFPTRS